MRRAHGVGSRAPTRSLRGTPYAALSSVYDATVGVPFLRRAVRTYGILRRRFGMNPRSAADLGAGTGLFAAWLARNARIVVFAVDRSQAMLAAGANAMSPGVVPVHQDVRDLRLPMPVDLATANCDTINHLIEPGDVERAFRSIARNLRPGGFFLFDVITEGQADARPHTVVFRRRGIGMSQCVAFDAGRRMLHVLVKVFSRTRGRVVTERHVERLHGLADIARWLMESGFVVRGVFDAGTLEPLKYLLPPRVVFVAQRAAAVR